MAQERNSTKPGEVKPRRLGVIFLTIFIDLVGFSIIFPLFPAMLDYYLPRGAGDGSLLGRIVAPLAALAERSRAEDPRLMTAVLFGGIVGSLYSLLQFVCAPLWGAWSDRVGRRKVLLITIAGISFSYLLWIFGASFWIFVISRVIGGAMSGNLSVATAVVADSTSKEKRSSGMAIIGIAFGLGFIVGPAVGGLASMINLSERFPSLAEYGINPFSMPAMISFILALLNFLWIACSFKETLPEEKRNLSTSDKPRLPVLQIFATGNADTRRTNVLYLIYIFAFSGMEFTLTFLAFERFAFSSFKNGMMFVYIGFVLILIQGGIVRRLSGPVGEKRLAVVGMISGCAAFIALALASGLPLFFVALALMGVSVGLVSPSLNGLVSLYSKDSEQGVNLGVFRSAGSLARAIGPIYAAVIYFSYGSKVAYCFGGLFVLIPFLIALKLPQPDKGE